MNSKKANMLKLHPLTVKDIRKETADCVSIALDVPQNLADKYQFIQGQNLALETEIEGQKVRRSYSICTSPLDNELRVAIKKVPGGAFSTYANEALKVGDSLQVMPPIGHFYTELDKDQAKHYVAFVAGSGITPVMSLMKTVLQVEPNSRFSLFYGNRTVSSIIFLEEIEALKNQYMERLSVVHVMSQELSDSPLLQGRLDAAKCKAFCSELLDFDTIDEVFLCGPKEMIFSLSSTLSEMGLSEKNIHFELFYDPSADENRIETTVASASDKPDSEVTIVLDGRATKLPLSYTGQDISTAGRQKGLDLPYACLGGMCCTCKAKLIEGEVVMTKNYTLEEDEVSDGFILTCQAHPTTDKVVVSFDDHW